MPAATGENIKKPMIKAQIATENAKEAATISQHDEGARTATDISNNGGERSPNPVVETAASEGPKGARRQHAECNIRSNTQIILYLKIRSDKKDGMRSL